jgi:hypothetical protein
MPLDVLRTATLARARQRLPQLGDQLLHPGSIGLENRVGRIDVRLEDVHGLHAFVGGASRF